LHRDRKLHSYSHSNIASNTNMCGTLIINCVEHGCELAKETGLCTRGKQGLICLNMGKYTEMIAKGRTFCVTTGDKCQVVADNVMGTTTINLQHDLVREFGIENLNASEMNSTYYKELERRTRTRSTTGSRSRASSSASTRGRTPTMDWETMTIVDDIEVISVTSSRPAPSSTSRSTAPTATGPPPSYRPQEQLIYGRTNEHSRKHQVRDVTDEVYPNDSISSVSSKRGSAYSNRSSSTTKPSPRTKSRSGSSTSSKYYTKSGVRLIPVHE
jgi:hypothetical protein